MIYMDDSDVYWMDVNMGYIGICSSNMNGIPSRYISCASWGS